MKKLALVIVALLIIFTASCESDDEIVVTFDGNECKVSGPSEIETGKQIFVTRNLTDLDTNFYVVRLATEEGKTFQDYLDYYEDRDWLFEGKAPPWVHPAGLESLVSIDGNEEVWERNIMVGGLYMLTWFATEEPRDIWVCPPLEVKEATTE